MGSTYRYVCPNCDYSAEVSGGDDMGMLCETKTILCKDCKKLYDVVTKYHGEEEMKLICPEVSNHNVSKWKFPDICPVCGQMMQEDMFFPGAKWD